MRVRSKIGYDAFKNRMMVSEHMIFNIMKSYNQLMWSGSIPPIGIYSDELLLRFEDMLDDYETNTIKDLRELA